MGILLKKTCTFEFCLDVLNFDGSPVQLVILDQNGEPLLNEPLEEPGLQYCFTLEGLEGVEQLQFQIISTDGGSFLIDNPTLHSTCTQGVQVANVMSTQDYYPFGMIMPGRSYQGSEGYRYGFNGKEMDNEVSGNGNQYDYGFRIYNPRLGKFLSVDPLASKFAWNSTYAFAENDVIRAIDLDGLEKYFVTQTLNDQGGVTKITVVWFENVQGRVSEDIKARPNPTPQNYAEAMVVTQDEDGNQIGQPELRALNALEKVALKKGRQEVAGSGRIGTLNGGTSRRTNNAAGVNENAQEKIHYSTYTPGRQGFMTTSRGNITADDVLRLDNSMATAGTDDVIRVDVVFSNQGLQDNLFEDIKSGLQEKYPGAVVNPVINPTALNNNQQRRNGRNIYNDASGQPNAVGLMKYESQNVRDDNSSQ